ncbi:hypothetical protein AB0M19_06630 [Streptomyces sp. NPDC051920]|uniref:hypothetical protein n=1 Tax=Streptomyces sp. NPDC051920 TaxID=3155523 RepID=UPI00343BD254
MDREARKRISQVPTVLALAGLTAAAWAGWLGWDQQRDVQADGSTTGPYEAWQVIGLGLTLLALVYWAASRAYVSAAVVGTTAGLAVAAYLDWSDDSSGLFVIGVGLVVIGSLVVTGLLSFLITSWKPSTGHNGTA